MISRIISLLLLAAGMASQGARFLVQADLLPSLGPKLWDTSTLLSDRSLLGQTLHALIGYDARPAGIQVLFYVVTGALMTGASVCGRRHSCRRWTRSSGGRRQTGISRPIRRGSSG